MRKHVLLVFLLLCLLSIANPAVGAFQEPSMADYTAFPLFISQSVEPNIMIMLDNSGSMNLPAYANSEAYSGLPYAIAESILSNKIKSPYDDIEELISTKNVLNNNDLDLANVNRPGSDILVGLRFQDVGIGQAATILSASIDFVSNSSCTDATNLVITGEASDDASVFETTDGNLSSRTSTTASVSWNSVASWSTGQTYTTPDLTSIVQEIVNRSGWSKASSMAFVLSGSGFRQAYAFEGDQNLAPVLKITFQKDSETMRYYGYFNPDYFYTYGSNRFNLAYKKISYNSVSKKWIVQDLNGASTTLDDSGIENKELWDGNWLNWLCMRRIDVMRKVLMGGLATARTGGGNQVNYGDNTSSSYSVTFNSSAGSAVSPFNGSYEYYIDKQKISVSGLKYYIRVQKDVDYEPENFLEGNLAGVLQKIGDEARWGNTWFNDGVKESGATVAHTIGTNITTLITTLQNKSCNTWTPLAESYYTVMQYFKQKDPKSGLGYPNNAVPNANQGDDPYYNGIQYVKCSKSFVILLTDGASTKDAKIPDEFKDYDEDGDLISCNESTESGCQYPGGGTGHLDDVALYARTNDLRDDLEDDQNLILYTIYAFGSDDNARSLLQDAARNGGFEDQNGDNRPNLTTEYDADKDGVPDTYFEASDGYTLESKLYEAITDILKRAGSGTAASVLSTNSSGEGNTLQAWFRPHVVSNLVKAKWLGYINSLWVDTYGNLREDTNENAQLDDSDLEISFEINADGDTVINRAGLINPLDDLKAIFEVGDRLAEREPNSRKIFTCIDKNSDGQIIDTSSDPYDASGEILAFNTANASQLQPYLGVASDSVWGDSSAGLGATIDERATNIISWVRGADIAGLRNRTLDNVTWPLGDIVNSSPVIISKPPEKFHIWYSDLSYKTYYDAVKNRETVIYVGANDGMLHAFTSWQYDSDNTAYVKPSGASADERIGDELWAFVPQAVLPHLKWISHE
ncbi:MAG: hypothetical protein GY874_06030, partial [Desulfobacteraceae bacterium]|nr:hypothetical protein [Desulfobacteraceae bacterium]